MRARRRAAFALALPLAAVACTSGQEAGEEAIGFYQHHLGDQWAFHCKFNPSCSNYGKQAVERYGLGAGTLMIADRLMRDHDYCYDLYAQDEDQRPLDPPADNALFGPRVPEDDGGAGAPETAAGHRADQEALANPPLDDDEQLAFADQLFLAHEWDRARIEYARLLFHREKTPHATRCHQRAAVCLARLGRRNDALAEAGRIAPGPAADETRALVLREFGKGKSAADLVNEAEKGRDLFGGLLALEAGATDVARLRFRNLEAPLRDPLLERVAEFEQLPTRSRWLAGSLSAVLPGAGQLYAGRPEDAFVAFLTNGILIGGTAFAWHRKERVTAGAIGFVAFGFYLGNVYGGVNAAARHDRQAREGVLSRTRGWLRQSNLWIGVAPDGNGGALGIYLGF